MNEKVLQTLEFDKIREQLKQHAASSLGRELAENLLPSSDFEEVVRLQEETDEAATVLRIKGHIPLGGIFNILPSIKRAEIGGVLRVNEFVEISSTIRGSRIVKNFLTSITEKENLPILENLAEEMNPPGHLERTINNAISENGEVLDSASEKLRSLRSQMRSLETRIREKLENMIRSHSTQKMLSDVLITIRNDRFVIPVKQEYRTHFGGMVHDQSSSGQTLFIEPQAVVEMNNELQNVRMKEQQEIERILTELSVQVAENEEDLKHIVEILRQIDFMFTKAKYGAALKASKPEMNQKGYIKLFKARHPFIPKDEVVANDIELGKDYTTIVITGPNTGGKTVTLKTVGLLTLMAQSGLQIPALDGSKMAVFQSVYADIGDEQSIEQSLSTFSSHMVNIVGILKEVNHESLVLFDELGAGTDPQEGAALAMSILDEVHQRGARVIATTHYPELKAYSYNRDGVTNASVEFDVETLSPTYRLLIGVPGRSNAFEISKRLGLPDEVINRAKSHIHSETKTVDNMIASLERSKVLAEKEEQETKRILQEAEQFFEDLKEMYQAFEEKKEQLLDKAKQEAKSIVKSAEREADEIIKALRKMQFEKAAEIKEHELIEAKTRLHELAPQDEKKKPVHRKKPSHEFQPGDEVKVISFGQKGHLIEKVSDTEWSVQIGILKMKIDESDMEYIPSKPAAPERTIASVRGKSFHVGIELDVRGERLEEALVRVEKYLDDALLAGHSRVSIVHGKGTGALGSGIQQYLKKHRSVKSYRYGNANEGSTGVTVVELK